MDVGNKNAHAIIEDSSTYTIWQDRKYPAILCIIDKKHPLKFVKM